MPDSGWMRTAQDRNCWHFLRKTSASSDRRKVDSEDVEMLRSDSQIVSETFSRFFDFLFVNSALASIDDVEYINADCGFDHTLYRAMAYTSTN